MDEIYARQVAKNIRHYMQLNGKTQTDMANDLNIHKATISAWCNGTRIPRPESVAVLCEYFHVSRADLMGDEETETKYYINAETAELAQQLFEDKDLRVLFDAARNSSPEDLQMAAELLRRLKGTNPDA